MEKDILQEINSDKYEEIVDFLKEKVPVSLMVLNVIKSYDKEDKTKETELKVFCPKGETSSEVVIVQLNYLNKCGYKFIFLYSSEDGISVLQEALMKTTKLNWSDVWFEGLHSKFFPSLNQVLEAKNMKYVVKEEYKCMFLPPESYPLFNLEMIVPDEFIIRHLTVDDTQIIDETWAYHDATTYDYIRHSILYHGGLGLVHESNRRLISWAVGLWNNIAMVYTIPDYRRRGCAQAVVKALATELIANNAQPVCLIKYDNTSSLQMFKTLGFSEAGVCYCVNI